MQHLIDSVVSTPFFSRIDPKLFLMALFAREKSLVMVFVVWSAAVGNDVSSTLPQMSSASDAVLHRRTLGSPASQALFCTVNCILCTKFNSLYLESSLQSERGSAAAVYTVIHRVSGEGRSCRTYIKMGKRSPLGVFLVLWLQTCQIIVYVPGASGDAGRAAPSAGYRRRGNRMDRKGRVTGLMHLLII
jgi:hypothetical protein